MFGKILKTTRRKSCSCLLGDLCPTCKLKEALKPKVYIEEPRRLAIPITISHYREEPGALEPRRSKRIKKHSTKTQVNRNTICRWYQRRKAARQLKALKQKDDKEKLRIARDKARLELEKEFLGQLKQQYQEQERLRALYPPQPEPAPASVFRKKEKTRTQVHRKPHWHQRQKALSQLKAIQKKEEKERLSIAKEKARLKLEKEYLAKFTQQYQEQERLRALYPVSQPASTGVYNKKGLKETEQKVEKKEKKEKKLRMKPKAVYCRPQTVTKYVTVERANNNDTFSNRCQNWCYRLCCQFYCCLTFVLVMGFVIICIL